MKHKSMASSWLAEAQVNSEGESPFISNVWQKIRDSSCSQQYDIKNRLGYPNTFPEWWSPLVITDWPENNLLTHTRPPTWVCTWVVGRAGLVMLGGDISIKGWGRKKIDTHLRGAGCPVTFYSVLTALWRLINVSWGTSIISSGGKHMFSLEPN